MGLIGYYILTDMRDVRKHNEELSLKNSLLFMVVKHTNDIPFEINFSDNTLTIYRNTGAEEILVREIDYYTPENMLARGWIASGEYPTYKEIFAHLTTGQKTEPVVFKFKINGKWD